MYPLFTYWDLTYFLCFEDFLKSFFPRYQNRNLIGWCHHYIIIQKNDLLKESCRQCLNALFILIWLILLRIVPIRWFKIICIDSWKANKLSRRIYNRTFWIYGRVEITCKSSDQLQRSVFEIILLCYWVSNPLYWFRAKMCK